jgi:hypothetical protein
MTSLRNVPNSMPFDPFCRAIPNHPLLLEWNNFKHLPMLLIEWDAFHQKDPTELLLLKRMITVH